MQYLTKLLNSFVCTPRQFKSYVNASPLILKQNNINIGFILYNITGSHTVQVFSIYSIYSPLLITSHSYARYMQTKLHKNNPRSYVLSLGFGSFVVKNGAKIMTKYLCSKFPQNTKIKQMNCQKDSKPYTRTSAKELILKK